MRRWGGLLTCCLAVLSTHGEAATAPDHTDDARAARHLLHHPPPPAPHKTDVGERSRAGVMMFNHPIPPPSPGIPKPPFPFQWQGTGAANGAESASKQFLHTHDVPVETQTLADAEAAAAGETTPVAEVQVQVQAPAPAGEVMETQSVAPAVALAPGTVTAQGNRFNTKAAAWQGHKGPPPPPISNQEAKAQEAQEKTVQKQADQEAKVEYQQKLLDDKQAENSKMETSADKFKQSQTAIEGQKMTASQAQEIKRADRAQAAAAASLLGHHHSAGFVGGVVAVTLLVMAAAMTTVWTRTRRGAPPFLQADSADVAVSRTLLSKSEPLPSYGAVMPTAGESIL